MSEDDRPTCRYCAEIASHGTVCCWCWVVEEARDPLDGHPACQVAARRLVPIKTRFKTAIEATRENCIAVLGELKQPIDAMPKKLRYAFMRRPEAALQAILDTAIENVTSQIRARVRP